MKVLTKRSSRIDLQARRKGDVVVEETGEMDRRYFVRTGQNQE